jgi:hypothetical protein
MPLTKKGKGIALLVAATRLALLENALINQPIPRLVPSRLTTTMKRRKSYALRFENLDPVSSCPALLASDSEREVEGAPAAEASVRDSGLEPPGVPWRKSLHADGRKGWRRQRQPRSPLPCGSGGGHFQVTQID